MTYHLEDNLKKTSSCAVLSKSVGEFSVLLVLLVSKEATASHEKVLRQTTPEKLRRQRRIMHYIILSSQFK